MNTSDFLIERELRIAARPETVYAFFIEPEKLIRWKGIHAELDPNPGGRYRLNINGTDVVSGVYIALEPCSRLILTWGWEGTDNPLPSGASTVEIVLVPDGEATILRLKHRGLTEYVIQQQEQGWDHFLPRLRIVCEGGDPGPNPLLHRPSDLSSP